MAQKSNASKVRSTDSELEKDLECPICLDVFVDARCLSCLHTFCEECIEDASDGELDVTCPVCRQRTVLDPARRAAGLKSNTLVNRCVETIRKKKSQGTPSPSFGKNISKDGREVCGDHAIELKYFCKECRLAICSECVLETHVTHVGEVCSMLALANEKKADMKVLLLESESELIRQSESSRRLGVRYQRGIEILGQTTTQCKAEFDQQFTRLLVLKRAFNSDLGRMKSNQELLETRRASINELGRDLVEKGDADEITATYQQWSDALAEMASASQDQEPHPYQEAEKIIGDLANECLANLKKLTTLVSGLKPLHEQPPNEPAPSSPSLGAPHVGPQYPSHLPNTCEENQNLQTQSEVKSEITEGDRRLTKFRVSGIQEMQGEDTNQRIVNLVQSRLGVALLEQDIEWSRRIGKSPVPGPNQRGRPILVKLRSFEKKGQIMKETVKLKGSGISLYEELSKECYALLSEVYRHPKVASAWTVDGVVYATIKGEDGSMATKCVPNREALTVI